MCANWRRSPTLLHGHCQSWSHLPFGCQRRWDAAVPSTSKFALEAVAIEAETAGIELGNSLEAVPVWDRQAAPAKLLERAVCVNDDGKAEALRKLTLRQREFETQKSWAISASAW